MAEDPKPAPTAPPPAPSPVDMPPTVSELKVELAKLSKRLGDEFITKAEAAEIRKEIADVKAALEKKSLAEAPPPAPKKKQVPWWAR